MPTRSNSGKRTRQKVRLKPDIGEFRYDPKQPWSQELSRQLNALKNGLLAALNGDEAGALAALGIVDGNAVPKRLLPLRPELEFTGPGVAMTLTKQRYVATIQGLASATGLDGVDLSLAAGALIGRASREVENISIGIVDQNNYPASTADWKRVTASGVVRGWTGFEAPDPVTGTQAVWFTNVSATTGISFTNDSASSSAGNKILTPGGIAYLLRPGNSALFWYDYDSDYWRIFARDWTADMPAPGVTDHGALTGLGDAADHTWATLVDGTRAFTGDQSMGNNNLTSINQAVMTGSSSLLVMSGGDIVQVDDITANGTGSTWNLAGGNLNHAEFVEVLGVAPSVPGAGEVRIHGYTESSVAPAHINVKAAAGQLIDHPEMVAYETGTAAGGATGTISVNFGSINGRSLSDGVFKVIVKVVAKNITASRSYPQINLLQWIHYEMDVGGTNTYSQIMETESINVIDGTGAAAFTTVPAYWNGGNVDTTTIFIDHLRVGGSTLDILWAANPGGTDDWTWFVSVKIEGQ
jgi:hypothetical protein